MAALTDPAFFYLHAFYAFMFGAIFGSFFNVCIYRIPVGISLSKPPSHCYRCGQPISWFDNIPLLSYWLLRGRCRRCGVGYSMRYFMVELLTAAMFLGIFLNFNFPRHAGWSYTATIFPAALFASMLLVATFTDIDHWIIPDRISIGGAVVGLALSAIPFLSMARGNPLADLSFEGLGANVPAWGVPILNSASGAAVGFGALWTVGVIGTILFRKEAMGRGDMKLAAMLGAFLGPVNVLITFILACVLGATLGILGALAARLDRRAPSPAVAALRPDAERAATLVGERALSPAERLVVTRALTSPGPVDASRHHLPFGPWLAVAGLIVYLAWEPIQNAYLDLITP